MIPDNTMSVVAPNNFVTIVDSDSQEGDAPWRKSALATSDPLKSVMRKTASTIAVVTARGESETRGVTVSTLTMVSLVPAIVSFSLQRHSQMENVLTTADRFYVHILDSHQAPLARRFAARGVSGKEQFDGLTTDRGEEPRLPQALATLTCMPHTNVEVGDHVIALGQVIDVEASGARHPLLYHNRSYHRVGDPVDQEGGAES